MLTKKAKYGLKAIVYLAQHSAGRLVPVKEIAATQNIPKKFLDTILGELRCAGFIQSKMGKGGGYALARPPDLISVDEVIRAIDGTLALISCAGLASICDDCPDPDHCAVRLILFDAQNALTRILDNFSLAEMKAISSAENGQFMWHI